MLVAAQSANVAAVVAFYAPVGLADSTRRSALSVASFITMPVQFHRATEDPFVSAGDVAQFATALRSPGTPIELFEYQAAHGFVASNRTGIFDRDDAELAWSRALPFLSTHTGKAISATRARSSADTACAPDNDSAANHGLLHR